MLLFCCAAIIRAQGVPRSPRTLQLAANDTRGAVVTAHSSSTLLTFTVEGDSTGSNVIDVATSDPAVVVSLILPSTVEITNANATSLGFTFTIVPEGSSVNADIPSSVSLPGTHTTIQIPAGQPSGVYTIKANATNANSDSGILATYLSSSTVRATATTKFATCPGLLLADHTPYNLRRTTLVVTTARRRAQQSRDRKGAVA
jgi:hypothetical protein